MMPKTKTLFLEKVWPAVYFAHSEINLTAYHLSGIDDPYSHG